MVEYERHFNAGYDVESPSMRMSEVSASGSCLSRKESYKDQRKKYRHEKKRVLREHMSTLKDPSVVVLEDWLKVRGTLKGWAKLWCVIKPNMLLLYKSSKAKSSHWKGTVLLSLCELIERPSKKDGFCFKLFHPLEQSIWTAKGPEGESLGFQPLPSSHLIFRAPSQSAGKCWMDALELSIGCSGLSRPLTSSRTDQPMGAFSTTATVSKLNEWEIEKHFKDQDLDDASHTDENEPHRESGNYSGPELQSGSESDSEGSGHADDFLDLEDDNETPMESSYVQHREEYIGDDGKQIEELAEENKSIIWFILKQVRPGMDLSKVVLPTFILEPRSFLDKLADYYYHADIIAKAVQEDDPYTRMKEVLRWYLSGFYKKPKGLKKPYNPILGETFRCYWKHPSGSRTFYVAEQVSHHPPVSALYVTNRQEGFSVSATILAKSKFYGNSTSAILDGTARLALLPRGEDYVMNMPYAYCKGILMGTLTLELGGKVTIECEKTGYLADLEFKLKPFLSSGDASNLVLGKLKLGKDTLATVEGRWDKEIILKDKRTGEVEVLWEVTKEVKEKRLPRYTIDPTQQSEFESERLWQYVSEAIKKDDQEAATEEKTILEEAQRSATRERKAKCEEWMPKNFRLDPLLGVYSYTYADMRPWDTRTDLFQYEYDYEISTKTRHKTPMIRTSSIISVELQKCETNRVCDNKHRLRGVMELQVGGDPIAIEADDHVDTVDTRIDDVKVSHPDIQSILEDIRASQVCLVSDVKDIKREVEALRRRTTADKPTHRPVDNNIAVTSWTSVLVALIIYSFFQWFSNKLWGVS